MAVDLEKIASTLDTLLANTDLSKTSEDGVKYELPDGYYLCEVQKAELTESKNGNPMVAMEFLTVEDGKKTIIDEDGYSQLEDATGTKEKKIYVNYVLSNETNVSFYVSDMLKFQDPETNESLFSSEDFKSTEGIVNVCDILASGAMVYMMVQTVAKKNGAEGETEKKCKPISWKRAAKLELI